MDEQARAFDVTQELVSEARPFMRAFDQARNVGDDKAAADIHGDDAEVGDERGERVIGNLRLRGRDAGDEG